MPRLRKNERVAARYFAWILSRRAGVWQADGRSNRIRVGRHSLATRDPDEARRLLEELDLLIAVKHGLAEPAALETAGGRELALEDGRRLYEAHVGRSRLVGGARPASRKRYRAVLDKFLPFAAAKGLRAWNQVTARTLEAYVDHLEGAGYAYRTMYLEATTIKQALAWLVRERHLPPECRVALPLAKPSGTDTYCWREAEVAAMLGHCRGTPGLGWLAAVLTALAYTGLRISELIGLRWADIDLKSGFIRLVDESKSRKAQGRGPVRTLKGGRGRSFPIHAQLRQVLEAMPRHADGYVFHGPAEGRLKADTVRRALVRDVLTPLAGRFPTPEGEIGFADGRLHSFRHYFCSLAAARKTPQLVVMRWLGHKDSAVAQTYFHLHDEEARRHMERLSLPEVANGIGDAGPRAGPDGASADQDGAVGRTRA